jgi:hypothetical protein
MWETYREAFGLLPRTTRDDTTPVVMSSRGGSLRMTRAAIDSAMLDVAKLATHHFDRATRRPRL